MKQKLEKSEPGKPEKHDATDTKVCLPLPPIPQEDDAGNDQTAIGGKIKSLNKDISSS